MTSNIIRNRTVSYNVYCKANTSTRNTRCETKKRANASLHGSPLKNKVNQSIHYVMNDYDITILFRGNS